MVSFDDLIPKAGVNLAGKSFNDLTPEERKAIRKGISEQAGAAIVGAADTASLGFGDEIAGFGRSLFGGKSYDESVKDVRGGQEAARERNPNAYLAGQLAGALGTGVASAGTKTGAALANSLRTGGLAARAGKAATLGAATGAASGFGAGSGFENRLESAGRSGVVGGLVGGAIPVVGSVVGKVATKKSQPLTSEQIKQKANEAYRLAEEKGGTLKGWFTNRFLDDIKDIQPPTVAGRRVPTDPKLDQALEYIGGLKNSRLTLQDAQNLDEYLGDAIDGFTELGQVNKSGQKLLEIQRRLRDSIESADDSLVEGGKEGFDALKEGRKLWSAQLKMRDIERIIQRAELTDNPATAVKTGFKNLLTNAKKARGYSKEELAAIESAAKGGPIQDTLRTFGSRLWTIAGGSVGGPIGAAAAQGGSMASRGLATRNAMQNAQDVARAVSGRVAPAANKVGGLPAVISGANPVATAVPAGIASGSITQEKQPTQITVQPQPTQPAAIDFNDLIPVGPQSSATPLMESIKQAESGGDPNAKNPLSSASGLYQFTDATWNSAVDKWGRKYGIKYSDKNNPAAQEKMMEYLTADNARILANKGIEATSGNLYFAHFMGAPAASKAISMLGTGAIAARSFPRAARDNPTIFFEGKRPRTIEEVYQLITSKVA